jgi:hypothetical protein
MDMSCHLHDHGVVAVGIVELEIEGQHTPQPGSKKRPAYWSCRTLTLNLHALN